MNLKNIDNDIFLLIESEQNRQRSTINLIASENYVSDEVMKATGSVFTNKYAEGYPHKRYYPGCTFVDQVEELAIERCKKLFNAEHVNVQPHSGSQANMAAYFSVLKPGDTILGMSLAAGGHLTHGHSVNFSGIVFKSVQYSVDRDLERLDYNEIARLIDEHKPKMLIAGASAYSRIIDFDRLADIARQAGIYFLADIAHIAGLVATGLHPTPIGHADFVTSTTHKTLRGPRGGIVMTKSEHADHINRSLMPGMQGGPLINTIAAKAVAFHEALQPEFAVYQKQVVANAAIMAKEFTSLGYRIVSGGTDNHLFIIDLTDKDITGKDAEAALEKAGITVTRSCIPFDTQKPWITSGIRLGTPAITTRGIKLDACKEIVHYIDEVLSHYKDEQLLEKIHQKVQDFCQKYPL